VRTLGQVLFAELEVTHTVVSSSSRQKRTLQHVSSGSTDKEKGTRAQHKSRGVGGSVYV